MKVAIYYNNAVKPNTDFSHTDMFVEVEDFEIIDGVMQFKYKGASTGTKNHAVFFIDKIAGYSLIR